MPVTPQQLRLKAGVLDSVNEMSGTRHIWVVLHFSFACQEIYCCFLHQENMPKYLLHRLAVQGLHTFHTILSVGTGGSVDFSKLRLSSMLDEVALGVTT